MAAIRAGRATACAPHVSWATGLRQPAQQILLGLSLAAVVVATLLRELRFTSAGDWLLAGGVLGLLVVALVTGAIRDTGGDVKIGPFNLPFELMTFQRRLDATARAETPGLTDVACRLCGGMAIASRLVVEVTFLASRRWRGGIGPRFQRYLYCELLTRAAADQALGTKPDQRAYLADQYGEAFAGLDPLARTRIALERASLPAVMVDELLSVFAGALAGHAVAPDAAMGTPNA
jgi:hypothetical protein